MLPCRFSVFTKATFSTFFSRYVNRQRMHFKHCMFRRSLSLSLSQMERRGSRFVMRTVRPASHLSHVILIASVLFPPFGELAANCASSIVVVLRWPHAVHGQRIVIGGRATAPGVPGGAA